MQDALSGKERSPKRNSVTKASRQDAFNKINLVNRVQNK